MKNAAPLIHTTLALTVVEGQKIAQLPAAASNALSSGGQVAVQGEINGQTFCSILEPDGDGGHWLRIDDAIERAITLDLAMGAAMTLRQVSEWPEPDLPPDLAAALQVAPRRVNDVWGSITPMARWEWVRWINATSDAQTRQRRIKVSVDKLSRGSRRPCCFNLSACTDPWLSKNGRLREST